MTDIVPTESPPARSIPGPSAKTDRGASGLDLVTKVGAVLDALERAGELKATEMAGVTGEPLSSIYRLLRSLNGIGWLDKGVGRGSYRLGLMFLMIGSGVGGAPGNPG